MEDIVVVGRRNSDLNDFSIWAFRVSERSEYEPYPSLSGGEGGAPPNETTYSFYGQCNSASSTAKALSDKIKSIPSSQSNEFSATAIGAGGGQFRAYQNTVFTTDSEVESTVRLPADAMAAVAIVLHSHPKDRHNSDVDGVNRYPSPVDWEAADRLVGKYPELSGFVLADLPVYRKGVSMFGRRVPAPGRSVALRHPGVEERPQRRAHADHRPRRDR